MFSQDNGRRPHPTGSPETTDTRTCGMAGPDMTPVCPNRPMLAGAVLIALLFLVAFAAVRREGPAQDRPAITHVETAPPAGKPGGIL